MRKLNRIVIHCTATKEGIDFGVEDIRKMHLARGFKDIGYHYLVTLDGVVWEGRPLGKIGAHAKGYNTGSIGISYVGGVDKNNMPKDTRTPAQRTALRNKVNELKRLYSTIVDVDGHRDLSPDLNGDGVISKWEWKKVCPCFDVSTEL